MSNPLTRKEAIDFLGLDEKVFDNYFKNAGEFSCLKRKNKRGRFLFKKEVLQKWLDDYRCRTIRLNKKDYLVCLDFALAQHFRGYVLADWGTARQREFGQKITNWVKGQLAEIAVKKFLRREFNVEIELDFEIRNEIVPQDITEISTEGKVRRPRVGVGIKSSKPKSAYLVLGENELMLPERKSDVYIFCRPDVPDDHLLRITRDQIIKIVKGKQHYSKYKDSIPLFENIPCEVAGYCWADELEKVHEIPGQKFDNGFRFVKKTGELRRSKGEWKKLISKM